MSQIELPVGLSTWSIDPGAAQFIRGQRHKEPTALRDPVAVLRESLEHPLRFEALRRVFTPDDHVTIVVDDRLPSVSQLLIPILEHLDSARIQMENVTLLTLPPGTRQGWIDELPDAFQDVRTEIHDPQNPQRMAYLATTKVGSRLYMNRTLVEADQLLVLTGRGYDPLLEYSGSEALLYPGFSNQEIRNSFAKQFSAETPGEGTWPIHAEAVEVAWLLGTPFLVQVIEGYGDSVSAVISGLLNTSKDAQQALDERWKVKVREPVDTVIVTLSGDPSRLEFSDLAHAALAGSRIVAPGGRVVILSDLELHLDEAGEMMRGFEEPHEALRALKKSNLGGMGGAFQWASAAQRAKLTVAAHSHWEVIEEIFATPMQKPGEVSRLLESTKSFTTLIDGHKSLAVIG